MADQPASKASPLAGHGAAQLTSVVVDTYNAELRDADGFVGDRASKRAFQAIFDDWRERLRKVGEDPLGEVRTEEIGKKKLDKLLVDGDGEAAGLVHGAIEDPPMPARSGRIATRGSRMKQPHTEQSVKHTEGEQNTGNHKKPGAPDKGDADRFGGTRAGQENVERSKPKPER